MVYQKFSQSVNFGESYGKSNLARFLRQCCSIFGYSDGGAEIFNYIIEFRVEGTTKWTRYGSEQDKVPTVSHTLTQQLNEDTFYEFRVAAENKAGVGPYSDISERVKTLIGQSVQSVTGVSNELRFYVPSEPK